MRGHHRRSYSEPLQLNQLISLPEPSVRRTASTALGLCGTPGLTRRASAVDLHTTVEEVECEREALLADNPSPPEPSPPRVRKAQVILANAFQNRRAHALLCCAFAVIIVGLLVLVAASHLSALLSPPEPQLERVLLPSTIHDPAGLDLSSSLSPEMITDLAAELSATPLSQPTATGVAVDLAGAIPNASWPLTQVTAAAGALGGVASMAWGQNWHRLWNRSDAARKLRGKQLRVCLIGRLGHPLTGSPAEDGDASLPAVARLASQLGHSTHVLLLGPANLAATNTATATDTATASYAATATASDADTAAASDADTAAATTMPPVSLRSSARALFPLSRVEWLLDGGPRGIRATSRDPDHLAGSKPSLGIQTTSRDPNHLVGSKPPRGIQTSSRDLKQPGCLSGSFQSI